ncbi:adenylosuccinate synthase [candidate division TA06 bacterium]|uniref:Adenylosuccinate synthetase n=1 Tax=candidate division TA06 bacterium TaxID=2250710 RepID=A0A933IB27_UNCT6|nr:adenylosuccinate synthase [candidate division TA06 bacterium]
MCIVGAQWGDEGKGKIVDLLAQKADIVARYQGGANAGHTVKVNKKEFVLHLIPSGIVHPGKLCLIGSGVVIDPQSLLEEMEYLKKRGISVKGRLLISGGAHLTMPYHKLIDSARESRAGGAIGTTHRGIGPTYADKAYRSGLKMIDLLNPELFARNLKRNLEEKNFILQKYYGLKKTDYPQLLARYRAYARILKPYITDVSGLLNRKISQGQKVLFEGAQGTFLDVDFGTYPFVTSSSTIAGGACTGLGIGPDKVGRVIIVAKAYTTRVGHGPFPTEFNEKMSGFLRAKAGDEVGRTTGRPRRCGWLDAVMLKRAAQLNGAGELALTKLDILDGFKEIKIAAAYSFKGKKISGYPQSSAELAGCRPQYLTLPGWDKPTAGLRSYSDLPTNAKKYIGAIEKLAGAKASIISVGSERQATILRGKF